MISVPSGQMTTHSTPTCVERAGEREGSDMAAADLGTPEGKKHALDHLPSFSAVRGFMRTLAAGI